jgi:hypothetical protein
MDIRQRQPDGLVDGRLPQHCQPSRGDDNAAYYAAYQYAVLALQRSLLRFPEAQYAGGWRWMLAYDMAAQAIIAPHAVWRSDHQRLNQGRHRPGQSARLAALPGAAHRHIVALTPLLHLHRQLFMEMRGEDSGSAFIWLLKPPAPIRLRAV